jgi:uncharacterized lipoprotein
MKPGRIAAWVVAAIAVPGLAACGVSSSSDGPAAANEVTAYFDHPIVWGGS